jgi:hypothetical protein
MADGRPRVLVIGAINHVKGFEVLAGWRRRPAVALPLTLGLLGYSSDDARLAALGVQLQGRYFDHELPEKIAGFAPDLILIPSIWPETYCYVLTAPWPADAAWPSLISGPRRTGPAPTARSIWCFRWTWPIVLTRLRRRWSSVCMRAPRPIRISPACRAVPPETQGGRSGDEGTSILSMARAEAWVKVPPSRAAIRLSSGVHRGDVPSVKFHP